jgi:hypothetical protein
MGEYLGREFIKVPEESTSVAPSPPKASKKQLVTDVIEDSEDLDGAHLSSGDDGNSVIPVMLLLSSCPPPRTEKKILSKFRIDAS